MDQDAYISGSKARMPIQSIPNIMTKEVLEAHAKRETGFRSKKTFTVSPSLKACAEDELVKKDYKEMVSRQKFQVLLIFLMASFSLS